MDVPILVVPACDGQTDGQTDDNSIYHASIASRGKNLICMYLGIPHNFGKNT